MARPGIMLYFDILEPIRALSDADKGRLLVAMLEYGRDGVLPEFDGMLSLAWGFIRPKIDRDERSYEDSTTQRKYAAFCKKRARLNLPKIPFEEWMEMDDDERLRMVTMDNEEQRPVVPVASRYPSTSTTATAATSTAVPTSTSTSTKASASTAAAAEGNEDDFAAAAADRKLKVMNGELGKGVVNLSEHHVDILLNQLGVEMFDYYVAKLADFIIRNGATVKSHYQTILKWWTEDCSY